MSRYNLFIVEPRSAHSVLSGSRLSGNKDAYPRWPKNSVVRVVEAKHPLYVLQLLNTKQQHFEGFREDWQSTAMEEVC